MSKNIRLNGTDYENIVTVKLPTTDGGEAEFRDADEAVETDNTVYTSEKGVLYQKNTVIEAEAIGLLEGTPGFSGCTYMESFEAPNCTSQLKGYFVFAGCPNLKRVILPKIASDVTTYQCFKVNQDTTESGKSLEEIQLGSVGHPITSFQYDLGSGIDQYTPTLTIYVTDETELPLAKHPFGFKNGTIVYRSSVSGEVREYTTGG